MKFELPSFLIGFAAASAIFALIDRFRGRLRSARVRMVSTLKNVPQRPASGAEPR